MKSRTCKHCNGTGRVELIDLGDGVLRTPEQAKARREADERISEAYERHLASETGGEST